MSTTSEDTPTKKGRARKDKNDPSRFQGVGVNFKAKLIGVEDVPDARGDKMCQEAIQKMKAIVKVAGEHKQRIFINVSLEGMKIMEEKSGVVLHHHQVHKISFISRDVSDARAFGYIFGPGDGTHQFFGVKTEKAAEGLVLTLRDLFQVVFEMKKREVEEAKKHKDENKENKEIKEEPSESRPTPKPEDETPNQPETESANDNEQKGGSDTADLLNLENELLVLSQGIEQMTTIGGQQYPSSPGGTQWATAYQHPHNQPLTVNLPPPGGARLQGSPLHQPGQPGQQPGQQPLQTQAFPANSQAQPGFQANFGQFPAVQTTAAHFPANQGQSQIAPPNYQAAFVQGQPGQVSQAYHTHPAQPAAQDPFNANFSQARPHAAQPAFQANFPSSVQAAPQQPQAAPAAGSWATFDSPGSPGGPAPGFGAQPLGAHPGQGQAQPPFGAPTQNVPPTAQGQPPFGAPTQALPPTAQGQMPFGAPTQAVPPTQSQPGVGFPPLGQGQQGQAFGTLPVQKDPFSDDPFFSSPKQPSADDKYAIFSSMAQPSVDSTSGILMPQSTPTSPQAATNGGMVNAAVDASPANEKPGWGGLNDPFADFGVLNKDPSEKRQFFKEPQGPKPSLLELSNNQPALAGQPAGTLPVADPFGGPMSPANPFANTNVNPFS